MPCASFLPLEKASEAHSGGSYDDTGKPAEGTKSTKRVQQGHAAKGHRRSTAHEQQALWSHDLSMATLHAKGMRARSM